MLRLWRAQATRNRFADAIAARPPHLLRGFKSLALAGRPAPIEAMQRAVEQQFVRTWTHAAHWAAAEAPATRQG
ncbi:MAG TPA: hypothetical protein VLD36_18635 [Burkholderiales bacterium]|nr:hypothetical protein [Burkholderiales bacterium]